MKNGQTGDAKLWTEIRQDLWVWNIDAKKWMVYEKGIWRKDIGDTATWDISNILCQVYDRLIKDLEQEIKANPPPDEKKDPRGVELKELRARRKSLTINDYLQSVENLATKKTSTASFGL